MNEGFHEEVDETHESWGVLAICRTQIGGGGIPLFGSSIRHHNSIRLTISRASNRRHLNQDWIYNKEELIEVEMSPVQWAEAITHMNCGVGTPVTIRHVQRQRMADCPETNERMRIEDEFAEDMKDLSSRFKASSERVQELLQKKGSLTVAEKAEINSLIDKVRSTLDSTVPFVHSQFNEAVEKTVTRAKGEIESFLTHAIMDAGKAALGIGYCAPEVSLLESVKATDESESETGKHV